MAIEKRNYIPGDSETISDVSIGEGVINTWNYFKLDGYFKFEMSNVSLYQGGSLVPTSAYELVTDDTWTNKEVNYSGDTLYAMWKITNATYADIETSVSGKNYGTMVDNEAVKEYAYALLAGSLPSVYDISTENQTCTLDAITGEVQTKDIFWSGGDGTYKLLVQDADSTQIINCSGEGRISLISDGTDWQIKSFYVEANTGWVANSDWANAEFIINHGLGADLSDLIVKFFISTDGTEANSFEPKSTNYNSAGTVNGDAGCSFYNIDTDSFNVQTGIDGLLYTDDSGATQSCVASYYYKVKTYYIK